MLNEAASFTFLSKSPFKMRFDAEETDDNRIYLFKNRSNRHRNVQSQFYLLARPNVI